MSHPTKLRGRSMPEAAQSTIQTPKELYTGTFKVRVHNHASTRDLPNNITVDGRLLSVDEGVITLNQNNGRPSLLFQIGAQSFEYSAGFVIRIENADGEQIWPIIS